jgi:hypothetical protein
VSRPLTRTTKRARRVSRPRRGRGSSRLRGGNPHKWESAVSVLDGEHPDYEPGRHRTVDRIETEDVVPVACLGLGALPPDVGEFFSERDTEARGSHLRWRAGHNVLPFISASPAQSTDMGAFVDDLIRIRRTQNSCARALRRLCPKRVESDGRSLHRPAASRTAAQIAAAGDGQCPGSGQDFLQCRRLDAEPSAHC